MSLDLALDNIHDIYLDGFDLALVAGIDEVVQKLSQRLKLFKAEWFLDINAGLPYYTDILVKSPKISVVEAAIRNEILSCEDIEAMTAFEMTYDNGLRKLIIKFIAVSIEGVVAVSEILPP